MQHSLALAQPCNARMPAQQMAPSLLQAAGAATCGSCYLAAAHCGSSELLLLDSLPGDASMAAWELALDSGRQLISSAACPDRYISLQVRRAACKARCILAFKRPLSPRNQLRACCCPLHPLHGTQKSH